MTNGNKEALIKKTNRNKKKRIAAFKKYIKIKFGQKKSTENRIYPTPPHYNEVFFKGTMWLDSLSRASEPDEEMEALIGKKITLITPDDFWD